MNFCSDLQNERETIKNIELKNNEYKVNYLDGSYVTFNSNDVKSLKKIEEEMLEQASVRDKQMYNTLISATTNFSNYYSNGIIVLLLITPFSFMPDTYKKYYLLYAFLAAYLIYSNNAKDNKEINELKKYRLFLEMRKELEKVENKDITKILEVDPYYRKDLNIKTIDEFTLREVKQIKKELKRRSNNKTY